jgi:hypothetical protein
LSSTQFPKIIAIVAFATIATGTPSPGVEMVVCRELILIIANTASYAILDTDVGVLGRGLKFVPTPDETPAVDILYQPDAAHPPYNRDRRVRTAIEEPFSGYHFKCI